MKLSLGMIVKNECFYLSVILPRIRACFDEVVVVDAESTDATRLVLEKMECRVFVKKWAGYTAARNEVIKHITGDWTVMLDADEALWPADIALIRRIIQDEPGWHSLTIPKHEFIGDHDHHEPHWYPDMKRRIFKMGIGYSFVGELHEHLEFPDKKSERGRKVPEIHLYHYGMCKPPEVVWLRHENYRRLEAGEPLLIRVPEGQHCPKRTGVPFLKPHPLKGVPHARTPQEYARPRI